MTRVNIDSIGTTFEERLHALEWLRTRYGPAGSEWEWEIDQLAYITFKNDKHATHFIMRFS